MKSKLNTTPFITTLNAYLILGIKFGIVGAVVGLIVHATWGNQETIFYTMATGFSIGLFVGFFEFLFTRPKILNLSYSLTLLLRSIIYFSISLLSVYGVLVFYLKTHGLTTQVLSDPIKFRHSAINIFLPI